MGLSGDVRQAGEEQMSGRFSIVKKGYSPEEVDEYLDSVREHLTRLDTMYKNSLQEIDELKKALGYYKNKEASIKNAIVNSQVSAENMMLNAKNAAENIVRSAKNEAEITKEAVNRLLSDIVVSMHPHRKIMHNFRRDYNALLSKYMREINDNDFKELTDKLDSLEKYIGAIRGNE